MPTTCFVITGSLTEEGCVAYLKSDDTWATTIVEAHPFETEADAEAKLGAVKAAESVITEPYVFPAELDGSTIRPVSAREILRAKGPSTRLRRPDESRAS